MSRVLLLLVLAACPREKSTPAGSQPARGHAPNFELHCEGASTSTASQLHCIRTDTRTGDVVVVDHMKLPVSNGPTAVSATRPGQFTTACASAATDTRADVYCVRMNTDTGELLLINLQKAGALPPRPQQP